MLTAEQSTSFEENGYLVVEDVLGDDVLDPVREDYRALMDGLYCGWHQQGLLEVPSRELDFYGQILAATRAKLDWFQPMDVSLPGHRITANTPMNGCSTWWKT